MRHAEITSQTELDRWVENLRDMGYPYLGSVDSRWTLLPDGRILWSASDPFDVNAEDWQTVQTQDELAESVFCWRHDC
jgi:hypothetical protein